MATEHRIRFESDDPDGGHGAVRYVGNYRHQDAIH